MGRGEPEANDPRFLEAFGRVVKTSRTARGWSRQHLATEAGISYSYLAAIENGDKLPSPDVRRQLAHALGTSEADLIQQASQMASGQQAPLASPTMPIAESTTSEPRRRNGPVPSYSATLTELEALLRDLSAADRAMVLDLARRLGAQPTRKRRREWSRDTVDTRAALMQRFWIKLLDRAEDEGLNWAEGRRPPTTSYFSVPSGTLRGVTISARFARANRVIHELRIDRGSREENLRILEQLEAQRDRIESAYGRPLKFEEPRSGRRAAHVSDQRSGRIYNDSDHDEIIEWLIDAGRRMREALNQIDLE